MSRYLKFLSFLSALFLPGLAVAQTAVQLTPTPIQQFEVNGVPCLGCRLFIYAAGTTTKITTYTDSTGATPQTNPIVLNSRGEPENTLGASVGIWVPPTQSYKMVFTTPTDADPPTNPIWTLDNIAPSGGIGGISALASNNAALQAMAHGAATAVTRIGFSSAGDSPPLTYLPSPSPCTLNSGAGDGGSQVPTSDGGCWIASFTGSLRIEDWGVSQSTIGGSLGFQLYVNHVSGSDQGNLNTCLQSAHPCLTWQHAVNEAQLFDVEGGNAVIHDGDSTNQNFAESVSVTNPLRGAGNGTAIPQIGNLDPSQIIFDGNSHATITGGIYCYGIAASNGAVIGVENITIAPTAASCQDGLFAQLGGGINIYGGVTLGATGSAGTKLHSENSAYGIQIWQPYTITGGGAAFASVGASSQLLISAGVGTITGSPTFGTAFLYAGASGVFQTNIANPWGGSPGAITGPGFIVATGGVIDTQLNAVAWPGSTGVVRGGGLYRGWPAGSILGTSGLGSGGGAAVDANGSGIGLKVTMTGGTSPGISGSVTVGLPFLMQYASGATPYCIAGITADGTGSWNVGALVEGTKYETTPGGGMTFNWSNNGTNLVNGSTYVFVISCPVG